MSEIAKSARIERTPQQKAEERRIRELHRQNPVLEVPADTIRGEDVAQLLKLIAAISRERESLGLTVEQLAERAGMEPTVLARLESGQAFNPTISTLFRLVRALGRNLHLEIQEAA